MRSLVPAAAPVSRHATAAPRGPAWTAMERHVCDWPLPEEASHATSQAPTAALPVPALPLPLPVADEEVGQYTFA